MVTDEKSVISDLVCSLLAVNRWTLEKTLVLSKSLEKETLFDMNAVSRMSHPEVFKRLVRAGYSRGDYITGLLVDRLLNVAKALAGNGLGHLCTLVSKRNISEIDALLLTFKGVGPSVLRNFKMLQGL